MNEGKKFDVDNFDYLVKNEGVNNVNTINDYFTNNLGRFNRRELELGIDSAVDRLRVNEIETALNLKNLKGVQLKRGGEFDGD